MTQYFHNKSLFLEIRVVLTCFLFSFLISTLKGSDDIDWNESQLKNLEQIIKNKNRGERSDDEKLFMKIRQMGRDLKLPKHHHDKDQNKDHSRYREKAENFFKKNEVDVKDLAEKITKKQGFRISSQNTKRKKVKPFNVNTLNGKSDQKGAKSMVGGLLLAIQNEGLKMDNEDLKRKNRKLKIEKSNLESKKQEIMRENNNLSEEKEELKEAKNKVDYENNKLNMEKSRLDYRNRELKKQNDKLEEKNRKLSDEKYELENTNRKLESKNNELKREKGRIEREKSHLEEEIKIKEQGLSSSISQKNIVSDKRNKEGDKEEEASTLKNLIEKYNEIDKLRDQVINDQAIIQNLVIQNKKTQKRSTIYAGIQIVSWILILVTSGVIYLFIGDEKGVKKKKVKEENGFLSLRNASRSKNPIKSNQEEGQ